MDGCNDSQARMVALGIDVTVPDPLIPPVGWYKCRREFAEVFCHEEEMLEHRKERCVETPAVSEPVKKRGRPKKETVPGWIQAVRDSNERDRARTHPD